MVSSIKNTVEEPEVKIEEKKEVKVPGFKSVAKKIEKKDEGKKVTSFNE